ncbi:ribonuclease H-like domain-containing protein [Tanacetum coccineum]
MSLHGYSDGEYDDGSDVNNVTLISKLDVSHPLHLHPNDFVALTVVSMKLKGTENYQVWSCAMSLALEGKNKTGFIDGSCRMSNTDEVSSILSRETLPDDRSAYVIISSEESHRIATSSVSGTSQRPNDNGNRRTAGGSTLVCENCGFIGHTIDKCSKMIAYPADFGKRKDGSNLKGENVSNNDVGSSSSNRFSDEQMVTLISLIKENFVNGKGVHSNMEGTYMNSSIVFNNNFEKFFCSNSSLHSKLVFKGLITDSGANQYITYTDKNLINVIHISYLKIKVTHPNGNEAFITRTGNMPLTDYLTLYDVLVVPEYCVSLMSDHKVARDSKLVIAFDEMHCYVMNHDLRKGKILGTGKQIGGLYYFDGNQVSVDDIIIAGNSLTEIEKVKQFIKTKFMIKDLGKLKYFLGIEVLDTPKGICLNQRKYCFELIDEFRLLAGKPSNLPMQPNISLTSKPSDTDPLLDNVTEYQKLIGKLIYLTTTRPDIAYTVSCLSQFMHNPLKSHLKTALKVIRYLKGSLGKGINVIKGSASSIDLKAYSDAYWARCA